MKKYKNLLILLVLIILIGAAIFGAYFLYSKVQTSLNNQERTKLEQEIQRQQIENLPELAQRFQKIIDNERYFSFLYSEDQVVDIIKDMERLAREESVTLTITQKETPKKKAVKKEESTEENEAKEKINELADTLPYEKSIRLEVKAQGQYLSLRNFLHKLETAPYALDVLSINATIAPPDEDTPAATRPADDSPFLLEGSPSGPQEQQAAPKLEKIIFVIETALYIQ